MDTYTNDQYEPIVSGTKPTVDRTFENRFVGNKTIERLKELGITLPCVAAPVAAYIPALRVGNQVWTSGQLPFVEGVLPVVGVVGSSETAVSPEKAQELARIAALNALAAIHDKVGIENIKRIVKITGYVASEPGFTGQSVVINGASTVMGDIFGEAGNHVRSAIGVCALPMNAPVEVEVIVEIDEAGASDYLEV